MGDNYETNKRSFDDFFNDKVIDKFGPGSIVDYGIATTTSTPNGRVEFSTEGSLHAYARQKTLFERSLVTGQSAVTTKTEAGLGAPVGELSGSYNETTGELEAKIKSKIVGLTAKGIPFEGEYGVGVEALNQYSATLDNSWNAKVRIAKKDKDGNDISGWAELHFGAVADFFLRSLGAVDEWGAASIMQKYLRGIKFEFGSSEPRPC